ncbi:DUF7065 domain-containing protein [Gordonia humi]|uniref:AttH domain-containing protein n=1 Tax=Gordonia humi TaxID=686429 RepID=A0A840EVC1_9ACTN|nr:hypothetical protein [Gordonia humi]MBB4134273.1 hypothetical protein [Gordonia humi]
MATATLLTAPGDEIHDRSHEPTSDESWQESWYLTFYDPITGAGGSYHLGLQTPRGRADVWNWTVADRRVIGHFESLTLPMPEDDLSDLDLGGLDIRTERPLRDYTVTATYPGSPVVSDIRYEAFTEPFAFGLDGDGVQIGSSHYETFGRVTGAVHDADGRRTEFSTWAFQDHSWGPRDWTSLKSHRWICATFGEDLFMSVSGFVTAAGIRVSGYVFDGEFRAVEHVSFGASVADDGYSPLGCDAQIWTICGRGYHVVGRCEVTDLNSHDNGWFAADGLTVFETGGRLGTGMFEVAECKTLTPAMLAALGRGGRS